MTSEDTAAACDQLRRGAPVHMVGVGGVGMAGLALLLQARGLAVSGCDLQEGPFVGTLREAGIAVSCGHDPTHLANECGWVIRSTAVGMETAEMAAAVEAGLPVLQRGTVLAALLEEAPVSIAIAGTHGKTTTATLLATLLGAQQPGWCIGGVSAALPVPASPAAGGPLVVEADESDGTLAAYHAQIALVTNVDFDHMEHFASPQAFEACFLRFLQQAERVLFCADDARAAQLAADSGTRASGYGFAREADIRGEWRAAQRLLVVQAGTQTLDIPVPASLPGRHNIHNLLGAVAACLLLGVPPATIIDAVPQLGLPARRYETIATTHGIRIVSDYAHHPTEIAALIQMARAEHAGRIVALFQPHRYSRTAALADAFPAAFAGVDALVLTPVYAASEAPVAGGMIADLYAAFRQYPEAPIPRLAVSLPQACAYLERNLAAGDLLLVIGAGDVDRAATRIAQGLDAAAAVFADFPELVDGSGVEWDAPIGQGTTYKLGGGADCLIEIASESDLEAVLQFCQARQVPLHVMGAGSNLLVSDLGVRGIVLRLTGACFENIRREGNQVRVGSGVRIDALQAWLTQQALSGLEFLEQVPGGVGGILRMNGGAYGHEVRERILWIRGLNLAGEGCILRRDELDWGYRGCETLRSFIVTEACFSLDAGRSNAIQAQRDVIRQKRSWMEGLRCSGSVFRNPPGTYAGRLIEEAGLKGLQVGGATVSGRHGNFIVAGDEATASDVLAVVQLVEDGVAREHGVRLVREVICVE